MKNNMLKDVFVIQSNFCQLGQHMHGELLCMKLS